MHLAFGSNPFEVAKDQNQAFEKPTIIPAPASAMPRSLWAKPPPEVLDSSYRWVKILFYWWCLCCWWWWWHQKTCIQVLRLLLNICWLEIDLINVVVDGNHEDQFSFHIVDNIDIVGDQRMGALSFVSLLSLKGDTLMACNKMHSSNKQMDNQDIN